MAAKLSYKFTCSMDFVYKDAAIVCIAALLTPAGVAASWVQNAFLYCSAASALTERLACVTFGV